MGDVKMAVFPELPENLKQEKNVQRTVLHCSSPVRVRSTSGVMCSQNYVHFPQPARALLKGCRWSKGTQLQVKK